MKSKLIFFSLMLAASLCTARPQAGGESKADKKSASGEQKEARWQGHILRINKDESSLSVRGGQKNMESMERQIMFDSSTEWTKQGKPADQSEFKEGSFVIVLGHPDEKGVFHARRIDLRMPR